MGAVFVKAEREGRFQVILHQSLGPARVFCRDLHIGVVGAPVIILAAHWRDEAVGLGHKEVSYGERIGAADDRPTCSIIGQQVAATRLPSLLHDTYE